MNQHISVIWSKNAKERLPLLINILYEYGIKQNKSIYFQAFDLNSHLYVNHLIALISKIDYKLVESYMYPTMAKSNNLQNQKIDVGKFMLALETIRKAKITISNTKILEEDWLNYVFDYSLPNSVIIIDNFKTFIDKVNIDMNLIKKHINRYSQKFKAEIILFMNNSDKEKYTFKRWVNAQVNEPFILEFEEQNHNILDINRKEDY